jgi:hypothetical protein
LNGPVLSSLSLGQDLVHPLTQFVEPRIDFLDSFVNTSVGS